MKRMAMKALALLCMVLVFAMPLAGAADIEDYVESLGYDIDIEDVAGEAYACDFRVANSRRADVIWTDAETAYCVTGTWDDMGDLYINLLGMDDWQSCRYIMGNRARIAYNASGTHVYDPLATYTQEIKGALADLAATRATLAPTATPKPKATEIEQHYVLNTNTHKFHYTSCSDAAKINPENRQDYTGTRQSVINKGFEPCGKCEP